MTSTSLFEPIGAGWNRYMHVAESSSLCRTLILFLVSFQALLMIGKEFIFIVAGEVWHTLPVMSRGRLPEHLH